MNLIYPMMINFAGTFNIIKNLNYLLHKLQWISSKF